MKIGIVCYPTFGGSGVVATELGLGLARAGHEIHFITYRRPARLNSFHANVFFHEVSGEDYPLFEYPPYDTALASKMVDVVEYYKLDLLHVHYAIPHGSVAYMARKILLSRGRYVPFVVTLHGTDITLVGNHRTFSPVVEFSINKADGVTAVSDFLKQKTYDTFEITNEIVTIYNFIDFDRFRRLDKEHFKKAISPAGEPILVHTSNFRKVKRVEDVIQVFKRVTEKVPCKLLLIGDGPERGNLEALARDLNLAHEIRFLGKQDAVEELLAIADVFILPSANESFGLAALEAMACEVPVVSSNVGGLPEVNLDGITGYLSNVGDVAHMAQNVLKIISDQKVLKGFRERALARAKEFDIENVLPHYESYYQRVIERARAGATVQDC